MAMENVNNFPIVYKKSRQFLARGTFAIQKDEHVVPES
jgi:hypothetical protein